MINGMKTSGRTRFSLGAFTGTFPPTFLSRITKDLMRQTEQLGGQIILAMSTSRRRTAAPRTQGTANSRKPAPFLQEKKVQQASLATNQEDKQLTGLYCKKGERVE